MTATLTEDNRRAIINQAIEGLKAGTVQTPARIGQDAETLADTLHQAAQAGSARAYKTAQRLLANT